MRFSSLPVAGALAALALVLAGGGCRTAARRSGEGSGLLHDSRGGQRTRPSALRDCHGLSADELGFFARRTPKADAYLAEVAAALIAANPTYFQGVYAPEHLCFGAAALAMPQPTAISQYDTGQIVFDFQFFLALRSNEQVAAVMAHELAHIVMNHGAPAEQVRTWTSTVPPPAPPPAGAPEAVIKAWKAAFTQWTESEADEVGYDLYREARLPRDEYRAMISAIFPLESPEGGAAAREACERDFLKIAPPLEPPRGDADHPSTCWRLYDFDVIERRRHAKEQAEQDQRVGPDQRIATKASLADAQAEVQVLVDAVLSGRL